MSESLRKLRVFVLKCHMYPSPYLLIVSTQLELCLCARPCMDFAYKLSSEDPEMSSALVAKVMSSTVCNLNISGFFPDGWKITQLC